VFRRTNLPERLIAAVDDMLMAGGQALPEPAEDAVGPAFEDATPSGDPGYRG
jgi:CRISPR-associated protein Cas1